MLRPSAAPHFLGAIVALLIPAPAALGSDAPFEVTELSPDAVVLTTQPWAANVLLVRGAGGIVLVDTPATPADTEAVVAWAEDHWNAALRYAVNSHWHADAAGGNQVLLARGVEVISSQRTAKLVAERGDSLRQALVDGFAESDPETAAELRDLAPTPANRTLEVRGRVELELGGMAVALVHVAPSHSEDSIGVFFPAQRVLYGGCVVRSDGRIINRREADADGWVRTLEAFAALDSRFVVPGHGRRFEPAMIPESLEAARALGIDEGAPSDGVATP